MKRSDFFRGALAGITMIPFASKQLANDDFVQEFVRAGHNDPDKVREMLKEDPSLVYASYNWGNGDFETALEGAGHVGNKEIANYLIQMGARPNLFTLAMLGENESVKSWVSKYPETLRMAGPHGFSLLHHASVGENNELVSWLSSAGLTENKVGL